MIQPIQIQLYPHPDYAEHSKRFIQEYDLIRGIYPGDPEFSKKNLESKTKRVCRFCGLKYPKVTFSDRAHLLPEMIGNKELFSDFECDKCNHRLSLYENDLAHFLGISRTISRVSTKNGVPGFKSAGKILSAKSKSFFGNDILIISREDVVNDAINVIDRETGKITIKYIKNPYNPVRVYKALLKWAISSLGKDDLKNNYTTAINYLNGKGILTGCNITGYRLPFNFNFVPRIFVFKKTHSQDKIHTNVMAVYFQNYIIALPIPLHKDDLSLFENQAIIESPIYPPYFTQFENATNVVLSPFVYDLSSNEKVKTEEDEIIITINQEDLKHTAVYDSVADQYSDRGFDPAAIKYLIVTRDGVTIDPKELSKFIKEQM